MHPNSRGGVTVPDSQLRQERGEPNTVVAVIPLELAAVFYFDEHGHGIKNVAAKVGGDVYLLPQGEQLAAQMIPAATWLAEKVKLQLASQKADVPATDSVDIFTQDAASDEDSSAPQ